MVEFGFVLVSSKEGLKEVRNIFGLDTVKKEGQFSN